VFLGLAAGCVSTKDRYETAQELTREGRYAEAAQYYIRVLREEPDWSSVRGELQAVGQRSIEQQWDSAEQAAAAGRYGAAVAALDAIDALRANAESVGVQLTVPDNYSAFRNEMARAAADQLIDEGRQAEEVDDWPAAFDAYEQARQYVQRERRLAMLDTAQARVALQWAKAEMDRENFHAAHERAAIVYELVGIDGQLAREAEALQQAALERGTRITAFLPVSRTRGATAALPEFFLNELNAVLQYDYWSNPPLFIAPTDPIETRRSLRRAGVYPGVLSDAEAAEVGRALGTDFVVAGELTNFERTEEDVEETTRDARLRVRGPTGQGPAWRDTSYVLQTFDLKLEATVEYRIIDARSGRVLARDVERVRHEGDRRRGLFPGDYGDLDLSGSEVSLFNREDQQAAERAIENQLIDRLAEAFAEDAFDRLLRRID
jgi:hypothetical protein